ncbi:Essential recombination function protein [uncultured Caudovirales phage]|uniref:Essential recombination function protein n=1 Tax=uncultured Caudovirales phage TaxID=2100421 RepID=A0A6J5R458_9CAUD|nr:Essential recombination function protein [uncultured Caudovirales phage]
MRTSDTTAAVFAALAAAQAAMKPAAKDSKNPAFKSTYADLTSHVESIRPAFAAQKLAVVQELTSTSDGAVEVITRICHASGEWLELGPFGVPVGKRDGHGYGSASSYARRYALSAAVGTVADDDDGNAAAAAPAAAMAAPTELPVPPGFSQWIVAMEDFTTAGLDRFRDEYRAARPSFRAYLEANRPRQLAAMIETARVSGQGAQ